MRRIDVTAVLIAIAALATVFMSCARRNKVGHGQTECWYNLKLIHQDYANFRTDHGNYITGVSTNLGGAKEWAGVITNAAPFFDALLQQSGETGVAHWLVCPRDAEVEAGRVGNLARTNISYFLSVNPPFENSHWILSGNRNLTWQPSSLRRETHIALPVWDPKMGMHGDTGFLLFIDGAVTHCDSTGAREFCLEAGNVTNQIVFP
jgi:hypothetical protein